MQFLEFENGPEWFHCHSKYVFMFKSTSQMHINIQCEFECLQRIVIAVLTASWKITIQCQVIVFLVSSLSRVLYRFQFHVTPQWLNRIVNWWIRNKLSTYILLNEEVVETIFSLTDSKLEIAQWCLGCYNILTCIICFAVTTWCTLFCTWSQFPLLVVLSHTDLSKLNIWAPNLWKIEIYRYLHLFLLPSFVLVSSMSLQHWIFSSRISVCIRRKNISIEVAQAW